MGLALRQEGWHLNENKAWTEFVAEHNIKFEWVAFGYEPVTLHLMICRVYCAATMVGAGSVRKDA